MIKRNHQLSIVRQCRLLDVNRSGYYYQPVKQSDDELTLMRAMDEIHLKHPYFGVRRITDTLRDKPYSLIANRKHVHRLMRLMGVQAIYS